MSKTKSITIQKEGLTGLDVRVVELLERGEVARLGRVDEVHDPERVRLRYGENVRVPAAVRRRKVVEVRVDVRLVGQEVLVDLLLEELAVERERPL